MGWTLTGDVVAYQGRVGCLLGADPVRSTVLLSVLATLIKVGPTAYGSEPPLLGYWSSGAGEAAVSAAVLQTPPHPLLVTTLSGQAAAELAQVLADRGTVLSSINGAEQDVTALASAWQRLSGRHGQISQRQRLYRLGDLVPPDPAPDGAGRLATVADTAVVRAFYSAFSTEAGVGAGPLHLVDDRVATGELVLWEAGDEPVSLAGATPALEGVSRIGPVYTPPQRRGRGYGAAVTAAASELARRRGAASVVLFTDLANPTSNSLYARLGYVPVEDRVVLRFDPEL